MTTVQDGVDQYLKVLQRVPGLTDTKLETMLKGTARSDRGARFTVPHRFGALVAFYNCAVTPEQLAAIELLATWRNQFVHGDYRHSLSKGSRQVLERGSAYFKKAQGGADVTAALARFDARKGPALADLVTLITTCQLAIGVVDEHLIHLQAQADLAISAISFALHQDANPSALMERLFRKGGHFSAGSALALLHKMGVAKTQGFVGSAPSMTRPAFDGVVGMGRNAASQLFGIARP